MSERDYSKLTVNVLKEELKKRGLDQAGKKADLVSRLESDDLNNSSKEALISTNEDTNNTEDFNEPADAPSSEHGGHNEDEEGLNGKNFTGLNQQTEDDDPSINVQEDCDDNQTTGSNQGSQQQQQQSYEQQCNVDNAGSTVNEAEESNNSNNHDHQTEDKDMTSGGSVVDEEHGQDSKGESMEQEGEAGAGGPMNVQEGQADDAEKVVGEDGGSAADNGLPKATDDDENKKAKEKINTEDDARIANEFCIEMKREKDEFQMKWRGKKFSVPFIGEIVHDLAKEISVRSFQVKQITLEDLKSPCFEDIINQSLKFLIDFQSNILDSSKTGFAKFVFKSLDECANFKESIKKYNESISIEPVKFEDQLMHQFLNKDISYYKGSIVDRLLYVGNLPFDVTQSSVGELFPDSLRLIFPPLKEIDQSINSARYVYLEYGSAEDVNNAVEKYKEVTLNGEKLFIIKALCIKKERFGLLTDTLRMILLDKVRKLKKIQRNPYGKSRQELQEVEKGISLNMDKLSTDSKHRKNWGMELGALDEERIEKEEPDKNESSAPQRGGGMRGGRGGASRGSYDSRRSGGSNMGQQQRYGNFSNYNNYNNNTSVRPGWTSGNYYGSPGFVNHGFVNQGYSGQQGSFYNNKRKSSDNYGGDWKRGRSF